MADIYRNIKCPDDVCLTCDKSGVYLTVVCRSALHALSVFVNSVRSEMVSVERRVRASGCGFVFVFWSRREVFWGQGNSDVCSPLKHTDIRHFDTHTHTHTYKHIPVYRQIDRRSLSPEKGFYLIKAWGRFCVGCNTVVFCCCFCTR